MISNHSELLPFFSASILTSSRSTAAGLKLFVIYNQKVTPQKKISHPLSHMETTRAPYQIKMYPFFRSLVDLKTLTYPFFRAFHEQKTAPIAF